MACGCSLVVPLVSDVQFRIFFMFWVAAAGMFLQFLWFCSFVPSLGDDGLSLRSSLVVDVVTRMKFSTCRSHFFVYAVVDYSLGDMRTMSVLPLFDCCLFVCQLIPRLFLPVAGSYSKEPGLSRLSSFSS